ncbi:disintegrin-like metalloprotease [Phakopsora pachyrhizi]|nr:disintegrin-like metalloprotease [Phakopsora pachyrhizi]
MGSTIKPNQSSLPSSYHLRCIGSVPPSSTNPCRQKSVLRRSSSSPASAQLLHNDSLIITFSLAQSSSSSPSHGSEPRTFHLSLRPTQNLIHPDARISSYSTDPVSGQTVHSQIPLRPENVLAYSGWVIDSNHVKGWWDEELASVDRSPHWASSQSDRRVIGWARILIHETSGMKDDSDLSRLAFEGSFESDGQLWHVKPYQSYKNVKSEDDAHPTHRPDHVQGGMVAWKQASPEQQAPSDNPLSSCAYDQLSFNTDPKHPVLGPQKPFSLQPGKHFTSPAFELSPISNLIDSFLGFPSLRQHPRFSTHSENDDFSLDPPSSSHLFKRQSLNNDIFGPGNTSSNFVNNIGQVDGCPVGARVVFIGVAADCTYTSKYSTEDAARTAILNNVNSASALFQRTFNVSLGVVELNVQPPRCPSTPSTDLPWNVGCRESGPSGLNLNDRLSVFSSWRGNKGGGDGAGLWHLMTNCSSGSEIGVAWLGQLCQTSSRQSSRGEVTSGTGVTAASTGEWQVFAHEIGHNFGAIHDCTSGCELTDSCCPLSSATCSTGSSFIMAPVAARSTSSFSPCSIGNICSSLKNTLNTTCLVAPGQRSVISLKQCGNGIVEPGEDCDPGMGNSTCCDPATCKFVAGADCDPSNGGCCTRQCKFASAGSVCRPSMNAECDRDQKCSGSSSTCPPDEFEPNGKKCGREGAGLSCAAGMCTSRDEQCRSLGTSLRLQKACPASASMDCQVSCVDTTGRADCIILSSNFVDGTSCGYGGRCQAGVCQSGSLKDTAQSWFESNLAIGIMIVVAAGLLGLAILFSILRFFKDTIMGCVRRGRRSRSGINQVGVVSNTGNGFSGNGFVQQPAPVMSSRGANPNGQWVDARAWNGR